LVVGAAVVVLVGIVVVYGERQRRLAMARFGEAGLLAGSLELPSPPRRAWGAGLIVVGLALASLALARPIGRFGIFGSATHHVRQHGADVLFLLDLSRSMEATDAEPSRLAAAKRAASAIAQALPSDRVGLLVFGGSGFLQLPPTVDRSAFQLFLDAASPSDIPDVSTNLEAAAGVAASAVTEPASTGIVLLSDGEDTEGKLEGAIRALRDAGVRTDAVGVGTVDGVTLMDTNSVPHRGPDGQVVTTRLMEANLQDIARRTGGVYARAGDVGPVVADLAQLRPRGVSGQQHEVGIEVFQWPLALGVLLLLAEPWVSDRWDAAR
jgi:Ca-activated chloride channel homolog